MNIEAFKGGECQGLNAALGKRQSHIDALACFGVPPTCFQRTCRQAVRWYRSLGRAAEKQSQAAGKRGRGMRDTGPDVNAHDVRSFKF